MESGFDLLQVMLAAWLARQVVLKKCTLKWAEVLLEGQTVGEFAERSAQREGKPLVLDLKAAMELLVLELKGLSVWPVVRC